MRSTKRSFISKLATMAFLLCVAGFASSREASADPSWNAGWDWSDSESVQAPVGMHEYSVFDLNGAPLGDVTFTSPMSQMYINYVFTGGCNGVAAWSSSAKAYVGGDGNYFQFKQVNGEWRWRGYASCKGHYTEGAELVD